MGKVRQGFLLACGVLLVLGLPAHAVKPAKGKAGPPRYKYEKAKVYHYNVKSHEEFKETDKKGSVTQRAYDGVWKSDLICGERSGERTPVVFDTRLVELKLTSFQRDGQEGPAQDRAVLEKSIAGEEKRTMSVEFLDDFGANEDGKGVAQGAFFHVLLGGFDATVIPQALPKPNRPWTRDQTYGMGKYAFTYKVSAKPETKLKQKCLVIIGEAKVSNPDGNSEYPKSTKFKTKFWFSQAVGRMVALEVEGAIQFYPQEERVKKVTVEFTGTDDLGPMLAKEDQTTKAFFDGLSFLGQKRTLEALEKFSTMTAYSSGDLAQGVSESLMDDLFGQLQPVYPQSDLVKVEADTKADPEVLSRLIERAPDTRLRAFAAYYLGLSKGAKDVQLLTRALEDTSGQARWAASGALIQKLLQGEQVPDTALVLMLKSKDPILVTRGTAIASRTKREKLLGKYKIKFEPCKPEKPAGYRLKEGESTIPAAQVETWKKPDKQIWSTRRVGIVKEEFSGGGVNGRYALYIPETYCESRRYPLILYLAGGGGNGEYEIGPWPNHVADKGYFVACPVAGGKFWWQEGSQVVLAVLADLKAKYNVDENRVYLMGVSNGGLGTDYLATRWPDLFAAAAPIAGNPVDENTEDDDPAMLKNLRNVPLRIMHGEADPVIPVGADRMMKARLDSLGCKVEYVETPNLGHDLREAGNGRYKDYLEALAFFEKNVRDPFPKKVSGVMNQPGWRYWVKTDSLSGKASFVVEIKKNNLIEIKSEGVGKMTLYLNKSLLDLSKAVTVMANGKGVYKGMVKTDKQVLIEGVKAREDRAMIFSAKLPLILQ
jgi:pimeloyl-ACP methyl ester carboxylesterase